MRVPAPLFNAAAEIIGQPRARAWADALDYMLFELMDRWKVTLDPVPGAPWAGAESLVIPVLTEEGYQAIIRFAAPNTDNPRVHDQVLTALRRWNGHGAVRVIAQHADFRATLQERLRTGVNLSSEPFDKVAPIWGQLALALKVPGAPGFVRVQDIAAGWLRKLPADAELLRGFAAADPADEQLLDTGRAWTEHLAQSPESWLLHADLHYYNILAGNPDRAGISTWKAIDPQPLTGPTAYMVAPILWNRLFELPGGDPEGQANWLRGFAASLCQHAHIEPGAGMGATVARELQNMFWYLRSAQGGNERALGDAARSLWVARALAGASVRGVDAHSLKRLG
ncbi:kinase [Brevibacterium sp. BRM-1]|uniref:aminoglycoside phosphotransferase family protein n=1 Tax=Brevibacterium sp. BRM-1 TaxID=2999062 RepID=UPI00227F9730|nr:aminoglycoside phosphotransferase family protein [Brevibacterium sp. BRM-1]WAL41255.1 kinase [Brevibacterium sp. BRM-1]